MPRCRDCDAEVKRDGDMCPSCTQDYCDEMDGFWDCPYCGGEGYIEDSCECETVVDICFCANPKPRKCEHCN